jgi:tetratricopeptide (TPR) repeat protein
MEFDYMISQHYVYSSWTVLWLIYLAGGVLSGIFVYWIGGLIYYVRVILAGGLRDFKISRRLFLYTGVPEYTVTILITLIDTVTYGEGYFTEPTSAPLDLVLFGFGVIAIVYSIFLSYIGVRLLLKIKTALGAILFVILPAIFYSVILFVTVYPSTSLYYKGLNYNEKGVEQCFKGDYDGALKSFKLALNQMTKDDREDIIQISTNIALVFENMGEIDSAVEYYNNALSYYNADDPDYFALLGCINILNGDIQGSIDNFEKALEIDGDNFDAHNNLGLIYMGDIEDEYENYERALIHNEKTHNLRADIATRKNLAQNYYFLERYEESLELFLEILREYPDDALALYFVGYIHYINDDLSEAKKYLKKAVKLEPEYKNPLTEDILAE